jgi:hypothetical protein
VQPTEAMPDADVNRFAGLACRATTVSRPCHDHPLSGARWRRGRSGCAQQPQQLRRIGVLNNFPADDPEGTARTAAFLQTLQKLGWTDRRNVRIDIRWSEGDQR